MTKKRLIPFSPQYLRFLLVGAAFTLAGPALFYVIALQILPVFASLLAEVTMHSMRCLVYNRFVFASSGSGVRTYLTAAVPLSVINLCLVSLLQNHVPLWLIACVIGLQGATIGYFWSRICYRYDLSARLRS